MNNVHDMEDYRISEKRPDPYSEAATRARWARIEAAHEELAKIQARLAKETEETKLVAQETSREVKETSRVAQETSRVAQETSREVKETSRVAQETSREVKETSRVAQETSREVKETSRVARATSQMVGNMGRTQGRIAEEFFHAALRKTRCIGELKFDDIRKNTTVERGGRSAEYDLILTNGSIVAVVEVKRRLRRGHVERMRKVLAPNFRFLFPEWRSRKLLLAVAYISASEQALPAARRYGYAILSPDGQQVQADMSCVRYVLGGEA